MDDSRIIRKVFRLTSSAHPIDHTIDGVETIEGHDYLMMVCRLTQHRDHRCLLGFRPGHGRAGAISAREITKPRHAPSEFSMSASRGDAMNLSTSWSTRRRCLLVPLARHR